MLLDTFIAFLVNTHLRFNHERMEKYASLYFCKKYIIERITLTVEGAFF